MRTQILILGFLSICQCAESQGTINIHAGFNQPVGDFGRAPEKDFHHYIVEAPNTGARAGINLGLTYLYPITTLGPAEIKAFGSININRNSVKKKYQTIHEENFIEENSEGNSYDTEIAKGIYPKYYNCPLSVGINVELPSKRESLKYYVSVGVLYNINKVTKYSLEYSSTFYDFFGNESNTSNGSEQTKFKFNGHKGLVFELGCSINDKFNFGLTYNRIGEHIIQTVNIVDNNYFPEQTPTTSNWTSYKKMGFFNFKAGLRIG